MMNRQKFHRSIDEHLEMKSFQTLNQVYKACSRHLQYNFRIKHFLLVILFFFFLNFLVKHFFQRLYDVRSCRNENENQSAVRL